MLAATGIHGVVSYSVARRRREIAIRVAVGATSRSICSWCYAVSATGALLGLPLAPCNGGLLGSVVYQGSVNDSATLSGVALIVAVVGLIACPLPARRALRLNPAAALYLE